MQVSFTAKDFFSDVAINRKRTGNRKPWCTYETKRVPYNSLTKEQKSNLSNSDLADIPFPLRSRLNSFPIEIEKFSIKRFFKFLGNFFGITVVKL